MSVTEEFGLQILRSCKKMHLRQGSAKETHLGHFLVLTRSLQEAKEVSPFWGHGSLGYWAESDPGHPSVPLSQ